jgi:hypothetical protein
MEEGMDGRPLNMSQSLHLAISPSLSNHSATRLLRFSAVSTRLHLCPSPALFTSLHFAAIHSQLVSITDRLYQSIRPRQISGVYANLLISPSRS